MKLTMELDSRRYDIIVKRGVLGKAGQLANLSRKILIVSDEGVPSKYIKALVQQCKNSSVLLMPQGEQAKTAKTWQEVLCRLLGEGFTREDAVVALGGGVVGDLAGFAAASYMRGISYLQIPTTTLSQIDSSIGGKTAINLGSAKNIVGAFHQPELVLIDPDTLQTLPRRHYFNGLAEAVKTGLVGSSELFELMENEDVDENIEKIIFLCLQYKMAVVQRDEREQGERKLLNFGHTIGHAIEAAGIDAAQKCKIKTDEAFLHGESIALGMLPMIEKKTLAKRTRALMKKLKLPLSCNYDKEIILENIKNDKKRRDDSYTVVKVKDLGKGYLENISWEELEMTVRG